MELKKYSLPIIYSVAFILIGSISLTGCTLKAILDCGDVTTFNTDQGYLNLSGFYLGNICQVDTTNKNITTWKTISKDDEKDITKGSIFDTTLVNITEGLSVSLSGHGKEDAIKAGVDIQIKNGVQLKVTKSQRFDIMNVTELIRNNLGLSTELKRKENHGKIIMIIPTVIKGNTVDVMLKQDRLIQGSVVSQEIGDFNVKISYGCQGNVELRGAQADMFYKPQFLVCDSVDILNDFKGRIDLTKYHRTQGMFLEFR